jgi:hypothetical protein
MSLENDAIRHDTLRTYLANRGIVTILYEFLAQELPGLLTPDYNFKVTN